MERTVRHWTDLENTKNKPTQKIQKITLPIAKTLCFYIECTGNLMESCRGGFWLTWFCLYVLLYKSRGHPLRTPWRSTPT